MKPNGLTTQMRKGALEFCVLALLRRQPRYGFELVQALSRVDGMLTSEGTIYPLLSRLRRDGLVETQWQESANGPPRRYYRLTENGNCALAAFQEEWATFSRAVDTIVRG
jgi:PadR family transcriptional regulator, regulatory protein PadR